MKILKKHFFNVSLPNYSITYKIFYLKVVEIRFEKNRFFVVFSPTIFFPHICFDEKLVFFDIFIELQIVYKNQPVIVKLKKKTIAFFLLN